MFQSVHIRHYRSCDDVVLSELPFVTALVGRNGAGKTNILRAINWLATVATGRYSFRRPFRTSDGVSAVIVLEGSRFEYSVDVSFNPGHAENENPRFVLTEEIRWPGVTISRSDETVMVPFYDELIHIKSDAPCLPALLSLLPQRPEMTEVARLIRFLSSVRYYGLDEPQHSPDEMIEVIPGERYKAWKSGTSVEMFGNQSDVPLRILHMKEERPDSFDEICFLLGENGIGLISGIRSHQFGSTGSGGEETPQFYVVDFSPVAQPDIHVPYGQLSAGTRRAINLITSMIYDKSSVMLIEHPEDSIHSYLLSKLLDILWVNTDPTQIILTTHSPTVFDVLDVSETRLVSMESGRTSVRPLTSDESNAARRFVQEEGAFSDFLETVQEC